MKKRVLQIFLIIFIIFLIVSFIYSHIRDKKTIIQPGILKETSIIPEDWLDNGIFSDYYLTAYYKLQELDLKEKIGQLFLVRFPDNNEIEILQEYQFGGYLFFAKDFTGKSQQDVQNRNFELQNASKLPLLLAVDEEGGTVVRISSNPNLSKEKFKSPRELYLSGGFDLIKQDIIEKSNTLSQLGINLNLAPVVDISNNPDDYIYSRTLGENAQLTSIYAKTVITASKESNVSYTLKHFPGYGNNKNTHSGISIDTRSYEDIVFNDILPFYVGIKSGAEAILVSHNIITSIDENNPASLSPNVHKLLRNDLNFTGIIITDDLGMNAVSKNKDAAVKAVLSENNLIITSDYENSFNSINNSLQKGEISEALIDKLVFRILAWKYYKGLL